MMLVLRVLAARSGVGEVWGGVCPHRVIHDNPNDIIDCQWNVAIIRKIS